MLTVQGELSGVMQIQALPEILRPFITRLAGERVTIGQCGFHHQVSALGDGECWQYGVKQDFGTFGNANRRRRARLSWQAIYHGVAG